MVKKYGFVLKNKPSEPEDQNVFSKSWLNYPFKINKKCIGLCKNSNSEPGSLNAFAKSKFKYSPNMNKKMYWFILENKKSVPGDNTISQNQNLNIRTIWTSKPLNFY